ncbi:MFS transporter [Roseovarius sp. CH_XMU1461]|uniref:MFS transporter n=1 Tax=Roseovarius sp. CH_XMU1461 TaxID=3107777 RepID=UPI00300A298B
MMKPLAVPLLALSLFTVTFAVNLQAPLYETYAAGSGRGAMAVTIGFAAYVAGLMPTLVLLGGLSDRVGRRGPIALALCLGGVATGILVVWPGWSSLVVARVLLGVGTALATTAGTAYMAEIMGEARAGRAALVVTSATSLGFGGGALATGISLGVQGATLLPASYVALFLAVPGLVLGVLALPRVDRPRAVSPLRLPVFARGTWVYGVAMALAWSTTGMVIAVVPLELGARGLGGWGGLVIFLAIFIGFLCQPLARRMGPGRALALGFLCVPMGFAVLLWGVWLGLLWPVLAGACLTSAASYGFTYLAALAEVSRAAPEERARAVAGLFVYAYVGFALPVMASGALAERVGLPEAMAGFAMAQAAATLITALLWARRSGARQAGIRRFSYPRWRRPLPWR